MTQTSDVSLASKRLPELQSMAAAMGIKGISKMRKGDLIAAISGAPRPDTSRSDAGKTQGRAVEHQGGEGQGGEHQGGEGQGGEHQAAEHQGGEGQGGEHQ
ncbi:MAG: Rho termination factor N-terminal domain-containing protein, partial [Actinomycetota bacterium]